MTKKFFIGCLICIPIYLVRLKQIPEYKIPEDISIKVVGRISRQPYLKGSNQIICVGPVLIITGRFPEFFYGQELQIIGKFEKRVLNPFQTRFVTFYPSIQPIKESEKLGQMTNIRQRLLSIRGSFEGVINQFLSEPYSSLLNGILWGVKEEMPYDFWQKLRKTGTLHIVVASGQNVTMVVRFLIGVLVWLMSRRKAILVAILGVFVYVLMVGAEAPVVRAGIMAVVAFLAQIFGKEEEATIALLMAAVVMLLISPLILFDLSFQLSFAAMAGIIWFYPILKKKRVFSPPLLGEGLATTLAAQLGVTPVLLINFGQMSFLSPLINALVLWVVPLVMILGFVTTILGLIIKPIAWVMSLFVWLFLAYFVKIIEFFGRLPWISLEIGGFSIWWAIGYYLILSYLIWRSHLRDETKITPGVS